MTNSIISYIKISIEALEPFRIADPDQTGLVDRPVVVNHRGTAEVPATGLVGSLRAHLSPGLSENILGSRKPHSSEGSALEPSRLRALGTRLRSPDGSEITSDAVRLVHSTAIDPHRGAAKSDSLRSAEEVPSGSRVTLWCEFDGAFPQAFLQEIADWSPVLGGGVGTGHGRTKLIEIASGEIDLRTASGLTRYLGGIGPGSDGCGIDDILSPVESPDPQQENETLLDLEAEIVDGLFTSGGVRRGKEDEQSQSNVFVPLQRATADGGDEYVLEGASIRGVLRSRVAYITASIFAISDPATAVERSTVLCDRIFGSSRQRGAISVATSTITGLQGPHPRTEVRMHVGIDRFTGGALPGLLFGEEVIISGRLAISVRALSSRASVDPQLIKTLLLAACRDIEDGLVGLGGRAARGYGTIQFVEGADRDALTHALPFAAETIALLHQAAGSAAVEPETAPNEETKTGAGPADGNPLAMDSAEVADVVSARADQTETLVVHQLGTMDRDGCAQLIAAHRMTALWFDALDGMFISSNLDDLDPATVGTHLWAWSKGAWLRARIDNGTFYVTIAGSLSPDATATQTTHETARINEAVKWAVNEPRLSRQGRSTMARLDGRQWSITTGRECPITFLHLGEQPSMSGASA